MTLDQSRVNEFARRFADRASLSYLDETAIAYEAARLAKHKVIVAAYEVDDVWQFSIVRGDDLARQYLRGESASLDFEAVLVDDAATARALHNALARREKPRLRAVK